MSPVVGVALLQAKLRNWAPTGRTCCCPSLPQPVMELKGSHSKARLFHFHLNSHHLPCTRTEGPTLEQESRDSETQTEGCWVPGTTPSSPNRAMSDRHPNLCPREVDVQRCLLNKARRMKQTIRQACPAASAQDPSP
jgi:hypothetical protein